MQIPVSRSPLPQLSLAQPRTSTPWASAGFSREEEAGLKEQKRITGLGGHCCSQEKLKLGRVLGCQQSLRQRESRSPRQGIGVPGFRGICFS